MILAVHPPTLTDVLLHMPVLPSTTAARCTPAPGSAARSGFSLVELLVVIGIIATMTGLVLGGLFRSRDGNRLLAAEQVLADAIRQARHTARSTGSPVELRLTPLLNGSEVTGAKLAGVSRTVLWSETFDKERDSNDDGAIDTDDLGVPQLPANGQSANGVVVGRSGNGRQPSADHPIPVQILPRGATIVRGGRTEGFYLSCSVRPPRIQGLTAQHIPLVMIGPDESDDYETGQCGIWLIPISHKLQDGDGPRGEQAHIINWELTGWVRSEAGTAVQIFAAEHQIKTRVAREPWGNNKKEFSHPISGGEWVDVGMLYDGRQLALYLNGRRIAVRRDGIPTRLLAESDHIHIGSRQVPGTPPTIEYAGDALDDVRLYRLGTAGDSNLPGNVVLVDALRGPPKATLGWRMLCQPDGRVEVSRDDDTAEGALNDRSGKLEDYLEIIEEYIDDDGIKRQRHRLRQRTGNTATILLGQLRSPGMIQNAELTVTLDGRVSSRLVAEQPGAPVQ